MPPDPDPGRDGARPPDRVNMADVAEAAGVSLSTVSRALRGLPGVSAEQQTRVLRIADELSYVVSPEASRLKTGRTGRIAVVVPWIDRWFFSSMLSGIEHVMRAARFDVIIYHVSGAEDRRQFFQALPARRKVDAVVVIAMPAPAEEIERLDLLGVEVVIAGGELGRHTSVRVDDVEAARSATQHLVDLGHRRVALIRTTDDEGTLWPVDLARSEGWAGALGDAGLSHGEDLVRTVAFGAEQARAAMTDLLASDAPPTAVVAHSDEMAFGCLRALRDAGLRVPEDFSVVGIDDHPLSVTLGLTTVRQPVKAQGETAARVVLEILSGHPPRRDTRLRLLPTSLVVRETTGPAPT